MSYDGEWRIWSAGHKNLPGTIYPLMSTCYSLFTIHYLLCASLINGDNMLDLLKSLRRGADDHRSVFAEFAVLMVFVVAEQMVASQAPRRGLG